MEKADYAAFEDAPNAFNRIRVSCADNVIATRGRTAQNRLVYGSSRVRVAPADHEFEGQVASFLIAVTDHLPG